MNGYELAQVLTRSEASSCKNVERASATTKETYLWKLGQLFGHPLAGRQCHSDLENHVNLKSDF
jgi:hypothetical protein